MDIRLATTFTSPYVEAEALVLFEDDFARAAGNVLGATPQGALPWTPLTVGASTPTGLLDGNGNAYVISSGGNDRAVAVVNADVTDIVLELDTANEPLATYSGIIARYVDMNNMVFMVPINTANGRKWHIYKRVGGSASSILNLDVPSASADRLRLDVRGSTFTPYVNDIQLPTVTITDTVLQSGTRFGFYGGGATIAPTPTKYSRIKGYVPISWS